MSWLHFILFFIQIAAATPARKVVVHRDEVISVKTAVGIATIIQVPDQPTSVVLGDSAAFKVEYLNQAITIKPLHAHATSNLYIHTDYERYSVKLVSGQQTVADYVVYLTPYQAPKPKSEAMNPGIRWVLVSVSRESTLGKITLSRLGTTPTAIVLEFTILPKTDVHLDPGAFWLLQGKHYRPIQDLLFSSLDAKKSRSVTATLVIKKSDLKDKSSASIEIRVKETVTFSLTKELLWKS